MASRGSASDIPRHGAVGFTLVEVLVALAVTSLLIVSILTVYRFASTSTFSIELSDRAFRRADAVMEEFVRDASCAVNLPLAGSVPFVLHAGSFDGNAFSEIEFFTAVRVAPGDDGRSIDIYRIRYFTREQNKASAGLRELVREAALLGEDGSIGEPGETVAGAFSSFNVALYDGSQWRVEWPSADAARTMPRAVRLGISWRDGGKKGSIESETFIPAGIGR